MIQKFGKVFPLLFIFVFFNPFVIKGLGTTFQNKQQNDPFGVSVSTCLNRVGVAEADQPWLFFPTSSDQMHTKVDLFLLAGYLIQNGSINASNCPAGGMSVQPGYANACGMAAARPMVYAIQNMYDDTILKEAKSVGVPPIVLRQLMRYEGQFYPGIWNKDEYGFGHVIAVGATNALSWNFKLHGEVCPYSNGNCTSTLLRQLDATCANCPPYGFNVAKAQQSVHFLAETLLAYCYQATQLVYNVTSYNSSYMVDYATIWRLTLMNYNVGPQCVLDTLWSTYGQTKGPFNWANIMSNMPSGFCQRGIYYSNKITENFYKFPPASGTTTITQ